QVTRQHASAASAVEAKTQRHRGKGQAKQCGPETKSKIVVFTRRPALAKEAMTHFDRAIALFKEGEAKKNIPLTEGTDHEARVGVMTYHAAMALMAKGDAEYEQLLAMKVPGGLAFDPTRPREVAAAQKRLLTWVNEKSEKLKDAQTVYRKVIS